MATHCRLHLGPALEEQNRARKLVQGLCYAVLASSVASSSLRSSSSEVETSWGSLPRGTLNLGHRKLILKGRRGSKTSILRRQAPNEMEEASGHKVLIHVKKPSESGCNPGAPTGLPEQQRPMEAKQRRRL